MKKTFEEILSEQKKFSDLVYGDKISERDKEEIFKSLLLSLHYEVSDLSSLVNIKNHIKLNKKIDVEDLKFKSVDIFRYILAILNLWEVSSDDFLESFKLKDNFLHINHFKKSEPWKNEDVVVVDIDDVLADFRNFFREWIQSKLGFTFNHDSNSYYGELNKDSSYTMSDLYVSFIEEGKIKEIPKIDSMIEQVNNLYNKGYYIQLLTSRPQTNLKCFYETYSWVENSGIKYNALDFSYEKYIWILKQPYFKKIKAAIDDSPKHAMEYSTHGVRVLVPSFHYNNNVKHEKIIKFNIEKCNLEKLI